MHGCAVCGKPEVQRDSHTTCACCLHTQLRNGQPHVPPSCLAQEIFAGSRTALAGIDILRKVKGGLLYPAIMTCWPCTRLHTACAHITCVRAACWRLVHTCCAAPPSLLRSLRPLLEFCAPAHFFADLQPPRPAGARQVGSGRGAPSPTEVQRFLRHALGLVCLLDCWAAD